MNTVGCLWQYVILETVRKYPKSADFLFIYNAIKRSLPDDPYETKAMGAVLEEHLESYVKEEEWCLLDCSTKCYSLTHAGLTYLSSMTDYKEYDQ